MALRPKWAVPQPSLDKRRPSHIISPPSTGVANQTVSPPVATASASSLVPVPQLSIPAPVASANASSPLPVPQLRVSPAAATASASAPVPVPQIGVIVPLATASANGPPPVPQARVLPPAATAATNSGYTPLATDILATSFESEATIGQIFSGGANAAVSFSTANPRTGSRHIRAALTASSDSRINFPTGVRAFSLRLGFYLDAWPTGNSRIFTVDGPVGVARIAIGTTGLVSGNIAGTASASSQATLGAYNTLDVYFNGTTTTFDLRIKINGGVERQVTLAAQTPADIADLDFYSTWIGTSNLDIDDLHITNTSADYPLADMASGGTVPTIALQIPPPAATASASALVPTVTTAGGDQVVSPPAATANASSPIPTVQLRVSPAAATASASAPVPVPQLRVSPAAATASASSPVPVPQLRVVIPTRGAITLGYSNQLVTDPQSVERLIGRTFNGLRQNQNISVSGWSTAISEYALGRRLTYRSVDINSGTWADVTAGTHDTELLAIASNLAAAGLWSPSNPAYICFMHEATVAGNSVYGTGQDYINAYRHVVDLWDANGYTAVKKDGTANGGPIVMVLVHFQRAFTNTLELGGTETPPAGLAHADFDPDGGSSPAPGGTTYYSGIGIDGYNSITSPGHLKYGTTASNLFSGVVAQAAATGKFTFVGEFGCEDGTTTTDHTNKADWLDSCRAYFKTLVGTQQQLRALLLTVKTSAENYNVDSSAQATAAFQRLGQDPAFYPAYATAFSVPSSVPVSAPTATASASAPVPTVFTGQTVLPPAATASASSPTPVPQLTVLIPALDPGAYGGASASASAPVPNVGTGGFVSAPAATASASSPVPVPQLQVLPAAATASASAPVPRAPSIQPPVATASVSSPVPTVQLGIAPPVATASASAPVPVPQLRVSPPVGTANASAPVPTLPVSAPVATASASSPVPTPKLQVPVPAATANASSLVPVVSTSGGNQTVAPPAATASGSGLVPVPQLQLTPPVATASASSLVSVPQLKVSPAAATASASALVPTIQISIAAPAATANASGPVPTPQLRVSPAASTANASALAPTLQGQLTPPAATANASAPVPAVQVRVLVPAATASASAPIPTISGVIDQIVIPPVATANASAKVPGTGVGVPRATASASARVPHVRVVMIHWPPHSGTQWPPDTNVRWSSQTNERW